MRALGSDKAQQHSGTHTQQSESNSRSRNRSGEEAHAQTQARTGTPQRVADTPAHTLRRLKQSTQEMRQLWTAPHTHTNTRGWETVAPWLRHRPREGERRRRRLREQHQSTRGEGEKGSGQAKRAAAVCLHRGQTVGPSVAHTHTKHADTGRQTQKRAGLEASRVSGEKESRVCVTRRAMGMRLRTHSPHLLLVVIERRREGRRRGPSDPLRHTGEGGGGASVWVWALVRECMEYSLPLAHALEEYQTSTADARSRSRRFGDAAEARETTAAGGGPERRRRVHGGGEGKERDDGADRTQRRGGARCCAANTEAKGSACGDTGSRHSKIGGGVSGRLGVGGGWKEENR